MISKFIGLLLTATLIQYSSQLEGTACEVTITVDKASLSANWRSVYEYQESQNDGCGLNLTIIDLQEALLALNTTIFHKVNGCAEVVISPGSYSINQSVYLTQNVRILGEGNGEVFVDFGDLQIPQNVSFYNTLTIYGSQYVEIANIHFSNSPGVVNIERVTTVLVVNSHFKLFSRGALDIYQCFFVQVYNCLFETNGFEGVIKFPYQYRGHAGGLSIGFDDDHYDASGTDPATIPGNVGVFISNCTFFNNTSDPREIVSTTELLQRFVFTGRGGAVSITINSSFPMDALITDSIIDSSSAVSFGGGLYLGFSGYASHLTTVRRTVFSNNVCIGPAGGLQIGFIEGADSGFTVRLEVFDSVFDKNTGQFGGGMHLFANESSNLDGAPQLSQVALIQNCIFSRNSATEFGAAMCLTSLLFLVETSGVGTLTIVDCTFEENSGGRAGVLSTAYLPLSFYGTNTFRKNTGRVLVISGTRAEIHGNVLFLFNDGGGLDSGALYVTSFGQLQLFSGADISFKNNRGILGAAIVVEDVAQFSGGYSRTLHNPLCVLRSENTTDRPQDWRDVKMTFSNNLALVGSAVFMNNIDLCSWTGYGPIFFDRNQVFHWNFINLTNDNLNLAHAPQESSPLWYVQTQAEKVTLNTHNITAYPGQEFSVRLTGHDEYGEPVIVSIRLTDDLDDYAFTPSASSPENISSPSIVAKFSVANASAPTTKEVNVTSIITDRPLQVTFMLISQPCPIGYLLRITDDRTRNFCECNARANSHIANCPSGETLHIIDGLWGAEAASEGESGDRLLTYPCPQHYCQCLREENETGLICEHLFKSQQPNLQCLCGRQGVLCGDCSDEDAGFSALLNNCKSCGSVNVLFIVALVVLDVLVVGGLLLCLKTSLYDWLYPTIFYLQIMPYITFHFPVTFEVVRSYVYYASSALSFYFIYDFCLGPNFSALLLYFIRLLPLLISVVLTIPAVILRLYKKQTYDLWPGLWLVILLQYCHVVYTSISLLNCPMLSGTDLSIKPRWFINGNIQCFSGAHIPLALLSIAILVIFAILLPMTLLYSVIRRSKKRNWLYNTMLSSCEAYKQEYRWWGSLDLVRRVVIIVFAVGIPTNEYWVIFVFSLIAGLYLFVQPYKSRFGNIVEAILAVNMLLLLLVRSTDLYNNDSKQNFIRLRDLPTDGCIDSASHVITISTLVLTPGYYLPLVIFVILATVSVTKISRSLCHYKKRKRDFHESLKLDDSYYFLQQGDGVPLTSVTTTEVSTDKRGQVPLSRILGSIYRTDTSDAQVSASQETEQKYQQSLTVQNNTLTTASRNRTFST